MKKISPQLVWKGFHWSFFINIQGLIISMLRFERLIAIDDISSARIELKAAANLMLASAASMELAGDFSRQEYEQYVRPTMMPPTVKSEDFSGLMFWDHAYLMVVWKRIQPWFKDMPLELQSEQAEFISAYMNLSQSHKRVCSKFGGNELGSLRSSSSTAIKTLDKFESSRKKIIANL